MLDKNRVSQKSISKGEKFNILGQKCSIKILKKILLLISWSPTYGRDPKNQRLFDLFERHKNKIVLWACVIPFVLSTKIFIGINTQQYQKFNGFWNTIYLKKKNY